MKFSERGGYKSVRDSLQIESIDDALLTRIWNLLLDTLFIKLGQESRSQAQSICDLIWSEHFGELKDETPSYSAMLGANFFSEFKERYFQLYWYEIYDLLEFISLLDKKWMHLGFPNKLNKILEKEMSGYRIVDGKILQTTDESEILTIEEAIKDSKWASSTEHFKSSLTLLTNRENPDYRNSIKESISAVEAVCSIIAKDDKATLGDALKKVEENHKLHGALKSAFSSLYGYTSDESGIRHKLHEDGEPLLFEDAKFMLVVCSAFVNYLKVKTS